MNSLLCIEKTLGSSLYNINVIDYESNGIIIHAFDKEVKTLEFFLPITNLLVSYCN